MEIPQVQAARDHFELGLPLPPETRFRVFKKALYRICRPIIRRQIAYNAALLDVTAALSERDDRLQSALRDYEQRVEQRIEIVRKGLQRENNDHVALLTTAQAQLDLRVTRMEHDT